MILSNDELRATCVIFFNSYALSSTSAPSTVPALQAGLSYVVSPSVVSLVDI
ncbi:MAG TPA: hypothetical protein VD694_03990 [Nitrososphaeraceae archaeon]|nr:hypothetical protein [Nitrososphaeraceae archaeon]